MREGYFFEGFLAIQRAVDLSIINELGGILYAQKIDVQLKRFPYPPYLDDDFLISAERENEYLCLDGVMYISFLATMASICLDIVLEKEKKLKVWVSILLSFLFYFSTFAHLLRNKIKQNKCCKKHLLI